MLVYHIYCVLYWLFVLVKLYLMDRNLSKGAMDQPKYSTVETRNDGYGSANQRFFPDPSNNINSNMRPPEYNVSVGTRPVLNYSIQTGEEFSLEFMRERVNARQHLLVPHASGDPNSASRYMGLKGLLGMNQSGSESGSDVSMLNLAEKDLVQENEKKASSPPENQSYYDSVRLPPTSSRNDINRGLSYASSGVSDSSSRKVKFLCSFGGKILPRPSDGKLRYVGGETRIVRITKDIFWHDLMQKLLAVYDQTHTIKYQLPGEDLDALVSVSSDEDLQNMMEECLQDGGSQRPRMFLFSSLDLEESQSGHESMEADSEREYVVAVNGIDLGSKKNSIALASSSGNNLEELLSLNVARGSTHTLPDTACTSTVPSVVEVPSSVNQSSHSAVPGSSSESNSQLYQGQKLHSGDTQLAALNPVESFLAKDEQTSVLSSVPVQYDFGSQPPNYAIGENVGSMPFYGQPIQQGGLIEDQLYAGIHGQDTELPMKEVELKRDSSAQKINEAEKVQSLEDTPPKEARMTRESSLQNETDKVRSLANEKTVSVTPYDGSVPNYISRDEVSVATSVAETGSPLLTTRSNKKLLEPRQNSTTSEGVNDGQKNNEDDRFHTAASGLSNPGYGGSEVDSRYAGSDVDSRYAGSEVDSMDFSYLEQPVVPPRVYHSERIPREQSGLKRLSKSGDSFGSPFMIAQAHPDHKHPIMESVEKLHDENVTLQSQQPVLPPKLVYKNPQTVEEGLEQKVQKSDSRNVVANSGDGRETGRLNNNYGDRTINDKQAALTQLRADQETSLKPTDDSASVPPEFEWTGSKDYGNNVKGFVNPVAQKENPITGGGNGKPAVGVGTTEHGDILIDINDRFPRDFLSDIFSKAGTDLSGVSPLPGDGTGLSLNMENHEPMHWSYFRNLAQNEFVRKDVSLMDQDHLGFSAPLTGIGEGAPVDYSYPPLKSAGVVFGHTESHISFDEDIRQDLASITGPTAVNVDSDYNPSLPEGIESEQVDGVNHILRESEYEDDKLDNNNTGVPHGDLSLEDFDITTLQIIKNEDLEELRELGSGTFGTVYHGKWRGTDVAIKRIKKSCFTGRSSEQERLTIEFWREAEILSKLHHPNVVAFYGVVQDGPGATMATVTEFMVNGSLRHVLLSKERHLDRRKRLIIAMDAAFGMEYLHSKNIVHFDLKCDNLLVNLKDPLRPICKVGDFGLSKIKRNTLVTGGVRGTLPWMAPELLNGSSSKVSEKVDVFSFGIVLWEILTGEEPYANMHYGAIIGGIVNNTLRPLVPGYCDAEWKLLMEQCWAPDPTIRPSFTEIARRLRVMSAACQTKPQQQNQVAK
ncbi:PREDICTED: uncharacterized protein LOC101305739 [Fragaria vesca subsp. vesca]|uniref:uncharacterized protein LOC101305739 n=1 Tax=Fragaria vesca subsp. vesca TaxID=101020 RepID=UPI0002C35BED|nr:PREDICTED: uncharacterized protein LOC101305739 [Fragaria vesca subsp. vesca]